MSFDTSLINAFVIAVFSVAALALVLSIGVVGTVVVRNRRLRLSRQQSLRTYYGRLALHH
jgi:hypothetical protein